MAKKKNKSKNKQLDISPEFESKFQISQNLIDVVVIVSMIVVALIIWWPTRYLPYWWDAAGFIIHAARDLLATNFWPVIARHSDFAHPPLLPVLIAMVWKIFGDSRLYTHLLMLPFLPMLGISIYAIARKLLTFQSLAIVAGFLSLFIPVAVAEYGQLYIDLPMSSLALAGVALWLYQRYGMAVLVLILAMLMKETAVLIIPLLAAWEYVLPGKLANSKVKLLGIIAPVLALLAWFGYHYAVTGWWLSENSQRITGRIPSSILELGTSLLVMQRIIFVDQNKWLLFGLAGLSLGYLFYRQRDFWKSKNLFPLWSIGGLWLIHLIYFSVIQEFAPRYGIFLMALLVFAAVWIIFLGLQKWLESDAKAELASGIVGMFACLGLVIAWHPKIPATASFELAPPSDLSYQDMIMIFRQASTFLELQHPTAEIYGSFPENQQLTEPYLGFVSRALPYRPCEEFVYNSEVEQVLYIHAYSLGHIYCSEKAKDHQLELIRRFEANGKWIELLKVASSSAVPADSVQSN